jgi:N-acetyl-anhydromuramyl-L-alanine amidase AmpD
MMDIDALHFLEAKHLDRGRNGQHVQLIVLHSEESPQVEGSARKVASYFATAAPASAHYTVDDKEAVCCVHPDDTAWQCRNANHNGIGIEHAGQAKFTREQWETPYSRSMLEVSAQLCAALCHRYGVPAQRAEFAAQDDPRVTRPGITLHVNVPKHGAHWDPGPNFPVDEYIARVAEILAGEGAHS